MGQHRSNQSAKDRHELVVWRVGPLSVSFLAKINVESPDKFSKEMSSAPFDAQRNQEIETWLEMLFDCKQLREEDVKRLCEKVALPTTYL